MSKKVRQFLRRIDSWRTDGDYWKGRQFSRKNRVCRPRWRAPAPVAGPPHFFQNRPLLRVNPAVGVSPSRERTTMTVSQRTWHMLAASEYKVPNTVVDALSTMLLRLCYRTKDLGRPVIGQSASIVAFYCG